jgi:hypothetical protein
VNARCSPTDALNLLIPAFAPMAAAAELTRAVHDNRCRLYCNGIVIASHIAPRLMVVAQPENDGRWTARIVGTFAMGGVKPTDVWEFEIDDVKALLSKPDTREEVMQAATAAAAAATAEAETARAELEQARVEMQAAIERMERAEARVTAAEEAMASTTIDNGQRRKPGPKPKYPLWRLEAAVFTHDFFEEKKRKPRAGEVAEYLQVKCDGWAPDESEIGKLLRDLLPG